MLKILDLITSIEKILSGLLELFRDNQLRKEGRKSQELKQKDKTLENVKDAKEATDRLNDPKYRDRVRDKFRRND